MDTSKSKSYVLEMFKKAGIEVNGRQSDILIHNEKFYSRVVTGGSLALGESYMDGWWDSPNIARLICKIIRANLKPKIDLHSARVYLQAAILNPQTLKRSKRVANVHYNLPSSMYELFLGPHNQYTSFYYAKTNDDEKAEEARLDLICRKLKLNKKDTLLDIGCGWGGFAKYAAKKYGCKVVGVSISEEQLAYAWKNTKDLPVTFKLQDYRQIKGKFTKIFSGGMLEHVGYKNYSQYFQIISNLLEDNGIAVIDCIGGIEARTIKHPDAWIDKYIFPNSIIPAPSQISAAFEKFFVLEDWHNFRDDYARTAIYWRKKFIENWPKIKKLNSELFNERFYRMWIYYLSLFEGAFYASRLHQWQLTFTKPGQGGLYRSER